MSSNVTKISVKKDRRRSSLKTHDNNLKSDSSSLLKKKTKRNSVSWGESHTFQFKEKNAMFQECKDKNIKKPKKEIKKMHQKFLESRKKSIKNEFSKVKELLKKNKRNKEEDVIDDEVKKNNKKNVKYGHEALNKLSESNSSSEGKEKIKNKK